MVRLHPQGLTRTLFVTLLLGSLSVSASHVVWAGVATSIGTPLEGSVFPSTETATQDSSVADQASQAPQPTSELPPAINRTALPLNPSATEPPLPSPVAESPPLLAPSGLGQTAVPQPNQETAMPTAQAQEAPTIVAEPAASQAPSGLATATSETPRPVPTLREESLDNIAIVRNEKVEGHMRFFHTAIRDRFEHWLSRLSHYRPLVERIFSEFDLPSDLVFLSLVESGFNPHAYSRAKATGPWQFMKGTAQVYGLRVDQYVDERRDPIKSTVAAARYLRDLYDLFGTWPLAMAAYNAGEGKVMRALHKAQADTFWDIAATKHIRRETKEYVPRFMAATIIARNPDQFGFAPVQTELHAFEEVVVPHAVHFRDLEKAVSIPFSELQRLNPELRRDVTPPDDTHYHLKVPVGTKERVEQALDQLPTWKPPVRLPKFVKHHVEPTGESRGWYRVRVGDSLWTIAKRFHLSVQDLKARNNLASRRLRPGELLAVSR
ncbi:MAG: LysM peptidoglycan-binding domain-containing protein [Nitrospirae bacterium]|nr:MAG: LysM peptidoglycan-binding domain-containing protein [Nitrospirota bacterium]